MIKHQMQPTHNSCVSTCLAMLAGRDAEEIVAEFHDRYWKYPFSIISIMEELDIVAVPCSVIGSTVYWGQLYLFNMPSLNIQGGTHQIIVDMRESGTGKVFDPVLGRVGDDGELRNFYTLETVFSGIWMPEWRILDCPAMRN